MPARTWSIAGSLFARSTSLASPPTVEIWVEWLKRKTHLAENRLRELKIPDWISAHQGAKLRWARKTVTTELHTWTWRALFWEPDPTKHGRARGHPRRRWVSDIIDLVEQIDSNMPWEEALKDEHVFNQMIRAQSHT